MSLFAAAILQGLCNNGAIPLYYELAIEATYCSSIHSCSSRNPICSRSGEKTSCVYVFASVTVCRGNPPGSVQ